MPEEVPEVPSNPPLSQSCPDCGAVLDISSEEPFAKVQCPVCGTAMRTRTQFNNFMLQEQLGMGGMGAVYRALDVSLNRMVALKVVLKEYSSDPAYHAKFEHEARITASINHPNVVKVYSFGSDHGLFYIAMELVDYGSLDDLINRENRIPELRVLEAGIQIAQGLNAAFKRGLIHRDVKPGNILFSDIHTAKIVDFGLALPMERGAEGGTKGEEVWGTPYYIAPEKLTYEPEDFRSDIYSLGASLFHAMAGCPCIEGETTSLTELRRLKSKPLSLESVVPGVSSATAYVINRSLCLDPGDRHQSYEELIEHLNYARNKVLGKRDKSHRSKEEEASEILALHNKKSGFKFAAAAVVVLVAGILFMFHDKIFPSKQIVAETPAPKKTAVTVAEGEQGYLDGRKQLTSGDIANAQRIFHEMDARQNLPHPLDRWVMLHEGLSALLAGDLKGSQAIFKKLEDNGMYSTAPEDRVLANFFVDTAHAVALAQPVPGAIAKDFSVDNGSALALFIFALNDWEMSQFDDAEPLFQAFIAAEPKKPYDWVAEYKPLAKKYLADLDAYKKMTATVAAAGDLQKEKEALEALHALQGKPHVPGAIPEKLALIETDLQKKIAAEELENKRRADQLALQREQGAKAFADAKAKFNASLPAYQFAEAADSISKIEIADQAAGLEKANLLKKAQWLARFKETLIADINTAGYPLPIAKTNNVPIDGEVHKASQTQIEIQTKYGSVVVLWTEMPASEILAMSAYFTSKATSPEQIADRQWLSGVFAMTVGLLKEGKTLLQLASKSRDDYRQEMPLFEAAPQ